MPDVNAIRRKQLNAVRIVKREPDLAPTLIVCLLPPCLSVGPLSEYIMGKVLGASCSTSERFFRQLRAVRLCRSGGYQLRAVSPPPRRWPRSSFEIERTALARSKQMSCWWQASPSIDPPVYTTLFYSWFFLSTAYHAGNGSRCGCICLADFSRFVDCVVATLITQQNGVQVILFTADRREMSGRASIGAMPRRSCHRLAANVDQTLFTGTLISSIVCFIKTAQTCSTELAIPITGNVECQLAVNVRDLPLLGIDADPACYRLLVDN